jgi:hypothetical protein
MYFGRRSLKILSEQLTCLNENPNMKQALIPVFEKYKNIRDFINDLSKANLRSWRVAYPRANRFRHHKLPRTRIISSKCFDIQCLLKELNSLAYNIDYDCESLLVLNDVREGLLECWINSVELNNDSAMFKLPETSLTYWNFRLFYEALEALKFNAFAHCSAGLKDLNWDGVSSFNPNNKLCYGIKRAVGGIRASYLRSVDARINEKFEVGKSNELVNMKLHDLLLYALKILVRVKSEIIGETKNVVDSIYNSLSDDWLYNRNLSSNI